MPLAQRSAEIPPRLMPPFRQKRLFAHSHPRRRDGRTKEEIRYLHIWLYVGERRIIVHPLHRWATQRLQSGSGIFPPQHAFFFFFSYCILFQNILTLGGEKKKRLSSLIPLPSFISFCLFLFHWQLDREEVRKKDHDDYLFTSPDLQHGDFIFFLNWRFRHFKSFLVPPKVWDSRSKVHLQLPTLSCLVSRGTNGAGSEKKPTETLYPLWECVSTLEMREKLSMITTKCLLPDRVEPPLATPAKVELRVNGHQPSTASQEHQGWVPPDDQRCGWSRGPPPRSSAQVRTVRLHFTGKKGFNCALKTLTRDTGTQQRILLQ